MKAKKNTRVIILRSDRPEGTWADVSIEYWHGRNHKTRFKRQYWPCVVSREHLVSNIYDAEKRDSPKSFAYYSSQLSILDEQGYLYDPLDEGNGDVGWERASDLYIKDKYLSIRIIEKAVKLLVSKIHKKKNVKVIWKKYPKKENHSFIQY